MVEQTSPARADIQKYSVDHNEDHIVCGIGLTKCEANFVKVETLSPRNTQDFTFLGLKLKKLT